MISHPLAYVAPTTRQGPFPQAVSGYRYPCVAVDKFTKWAEVEPMHTIPAASAVKFTKVSQGQGPS